MMNFTDATGDGWTLTITVGAAKRVRDLLKVDLLQPLAGEPPLLTRLSTDLILLCDVLYVICQPQADERSLTDVQFAERLGGEALEQAHEAFLGGLVDFFRQLRRTDLVAAIERQREVVRRAVGLTEQTVAGAEFSAIIERELQKIPGSLSGDSPDSSASTLAPSPSAS